MSENQDSSEEITDKTKVLQGDPATLSAELKKAKEQPACLILIRGTPQGHRYFLSQPEMTLGRDPALDLSFQDPGISRRHVQFRNEGALGGKVFLTDLGSSNGTFVNDQRMAPHQPVLLAKEDMIKVGNTILKFLPAGELEILFYGNLGSAAHLDALTQIYNKGYLLEALEAEFKRAKALHTELSLIFFDLDYFKKINDQYGHEAGDRVLQEVAQLIRSSQLRPKDLFARYGGEEFVILLANTPLKAAGDLAERIRAATEWHAFLYENQRLPVTMSIGVATLSTEIESSQTLLKQADKALYRAKDAGRNRVVTVASSGLF